MYKSTIKYFAKDFKWSEKFQEKLSGDMVKEIQFYDGIKASMGYLNAVPMPMTAFDENIGKWIVPTKYGQLQISTEWRKDFQSCHRRFLSKEICELHKVDYIERPNNLHELLNGVNRFSHKWNFYTHDAEELITTNADEIYDIQNVFFVDSKDFTFNGEIYPCEGFSIANRGDVVVCLQEEELQLGVILAFYDGQVRCDVDGVNDLASYRLATKEDVEKWLKSDISSKYAKNAIKLATELQKQL